jgi:hypothetical protein
MGWNGGPKFRDTFDGAQNNDKKRKFKHPKWEPAVVTSTMKNRVSKIWDNTSQLTISGPQEKARYRQMFFPKPDR